MEEVPILREENECIDLPPGFRFHPTDEEIITHYLSSKVFNHNFTARAMGEVDLNKCEPWDLPKKAKMGEKEWYFFCQRDKKYPTGMRTNRATESGYWKATGKDKEIYRGRDCLVGMKKTLVFYEGRAPKGVKSNWVMHEFRLEGKVSYYNLPKTSKNEWTVCKVFHKSNKPSSSFIEDIDDSYKRSTITSSRTSDGIHMSCICTGMENPEGNNSSPHPNSFPYISGYLHHIRNNSIPNFPSSGYGSPDMAMFRALAATEEASDLRRLCKVDKFSIRSMVSQDTGLSTEVNAEISSETTKHEIDSSTCYEGLDCLPSIGPIDMECLWNY